MIPGPRRPRSTPRVTEPRRCTVVLSAAAERAVQRDLSRAVAVAVVDFLHGPRAADPCRVGEPVRPDDRTGLPGADRDRTPGHDCGPGHTMAG